MRIHPVVNVSWVVQYRKQVEGQKKEEAKPIEVEGVKEWEVEKILNNRKMRGVNQYLVCWKGFIAENDTWEREKDLKHARELVDKFKGRLSMEVRRQERGYQKQKGISPRIEECRSVRVARSELSPFLIFFLFSIFYFLAPKVRISDDIGHMAQRRF